MSELKVEVVNSREELGSLRGAWNETLERSGIYPPRRRKRILYDIKVKIRIVNWHISRLRAMGFLEMAYRARRILKLDVLRLKLSLFINKKCSSSRSLKRVRFFLNEEDLDFIRKEFRGTKYARLTKFKDFFRQKEEAIRLEKTKVDVLRRRPGFGNIEIIKIWEFYRFQWLVAYAQKYALEKDEGIAKEIVCILREWIEKNPPLKGINWLDPLEASLRLLSWTWIYFLIKDYIVFDRDFEDLFLKSVYAHCKFIEFNLSRYSSANNHLIGEGVGLFITAILFPNLNGANARFNKAKDILEKEIKKQVYPDGVCKEQSTKYHEFVTDLYLLAIIIAEKNNIRFPKDMRSRVEKMCEFLMYIMDKKGNVPPIGDSDDGLAIKLNIFKDSPRAISILNAASVLFERPDFKKTRDGIDERGLWLLGREGSKRYALLKSAGRIPLSKGFLDGGYYIMRYKDLLLGFDCGKTGYLSLAAHGHADALSVILNVAGKQILVDPGTYLYHSGGRWRDYFRGTMAHNTVRVDRLNQSEIKGPFLWGHKAESHLKYWSPNGGYDKVCGYHTGYTRLKDPVVHSREITFDKLNRRIILKDNLCSQKRHFAELFFHLHPDCSLTRIDGNGFEISSADVIVYIELDKALDVHILEGEEDPICGWYSERFGEKKKTSTICAKNYFSGNADFITRIYIGHKK